MNGDAFGRQFVSGFVSQQQDAAARPCRSVVGQVGDEFVQHTRVGHGEQGWGGVVEDVGPFRAVLVGVHGGVSGPNPVGSVGNGGPLNRVVEDHGDTVAGLHANSSELLPHSGGEVAKFVVGKVGSCHTRCGDVAKAGQIAEAVYAGHQHLVQSSGVVAFGLLPLSVVGLAFPCKFKGFHAARVWR